MSNNPRDMRDYLRTVERLLAQARAVPAMISNAVGGIREEVEETKSRHPAPPIEILSQTALYWDANLARHRARLMVDFPDVLFNTDGTQADIQQYELWGREAFDEQDPEVEETVWALQATSATSSFRAEGYIPGSQWHFRVRALGMDAVQPGEWSEEFAALMLKDTEAPPQPTAPTVEVTRGQLVVSWDGQAVSGDMPADTIYAVLAHGTTSSPVEEIHRFGPEGGSKVVTGAEYNKPQFFRLRAVDESGNLSPWSAQATGVATPLVDSDVILSEIDAAKTHLKNVNAGVSILPNTVITEHLVVTEDMTAALAQFLVVKADHIDANSVWADEAWFGLADALLFRGDAFVGKSFEGGVFTTSQGGKFQTELAAGRGLKIDSAGMQGFSPDGVQTFDFNSSTGDLSIAGGTFTGSTFRTAVSGARTEMTKEGIRTIDSAGQELMRIGYGIGSGMSLRNPGNGVLAPVSNLLFGGTTWQAPSRVQISLPEDVSNQQSTTIQQMGYTAVSTSVIMFASSNLWLDYVWPGHYMTSSAAARTRLRLVPRRGSAVPTPTMRGTQYAELESLTWSADTSNNRASVSWVCWFEGLVVGEVYDMEIWFSTLMRPYFLEQYRNQANELISVQTTMFRPQMWYSTQPACTILPR